jgi:hypothetical protein
MTKRHNQLAGIIRRAIVEWVAGDVTSEIRENTTILEDDLSQEVRDLSQDLVFTRRENQREVIEIIKFSCPYGYMTQGENTLKRVFEQKQRNYRQLAQEVSNLRHERVQVTAVIVSSLGAVYMQSSKDLHTVLRYDDRQLRKLGRRMSEAVIGGLMEIWRQFAHKMSHERRVGEAGEAGEAREDERVVEGVDGNGEGRKVDLIIGREVGGLEEEFERREDEGRRVWGRNQSSDEDEDEDEEIDEGRRGAEGGPGRDRGHDGEKRMLFQEDRVGGIVAISEMEDDDEEVGF